ncbi:VOC family protein [Deinococcus aluminii]|uniref:VOC family protein n=1 Tax=Deinococcus aluminii TaxID=1656885 RepID=UPI003CD071D0
MVVCSVNAPAVGRSACFTVGKGKLRARPLARIADGPGHAATPGDEALGTCPARHANIENTKSPSVRAIAHIGLTVSDLQHATNFWQQVLGFMLEGTAAGSGSLLAETTGVAGAHSKLALIALPHSDRSAPGRPYHRLCALPRAPTCLAGQELDAAYIRS